MSTPRIAAIHDLSAFGRCSLTVILPTLAAMGTQCCPLPTAYLSTHTGGFQDNTFLDLTDQISPVAAHWKSENITFDAIYTGFMSSQVQISIVEKFIRDFRTPSCQIMIDPVMGDHGCPYRTYTAEMCRAMTTLAEFADVITPNPTEAAILLDEDYAAFQPDSQSGCRRWAQRLSRDGARSVVLKGVSLAPGTIGAVCFDRHTAKTEFVSAPLTPGQFHGTGDLFASVLTGALARGWALFEAAQLAADFTAQCVRRQRTPSREGLDFEPLLWRLGQRMEGSPCRS